MRISRTTLRCPSVICRSSSPSSSTVKYAPISARPPLPPLQDSAHQTCEHSGAEKSQRSEALLTPMCQGGGIGTRCAHEFVRTRWNLGFMLNSTHHHVFILGG